MSEIVIGRPYIENLNNGKSRLCCEISKENKKNILYFEVSTPYKDFFVDDRCDAFLIGLLHTAMYDDLSIVCESFVSERLLFQLNNYFIPIVSSRMKDLHTISITASPITDEIETKGAVGTGLSGGVDSFYTVMKYKDIKYSNNRLTHLLFNNIDTADIDESRIRMQYDKAVQEKKQIASELGLEFIDVYCNLYEFYKHPGIYNHYFAMQYASIPLALGHLFGVFYFSSSYTLDSFSMDYKKIPSGAPFDLFTLESVSTDSLVFYSAGMEVTRFQKMMSFVNEPVPQKHLQVCGGLQDYGGPRRMTKLNCGTCMKCSRAIVSLELLGKLREYQDIISLDSYNSNKEKFIGRYLAGDKGIFSSEIERELFNQKLMTFRIRMWRVIYAIRFKLSKNEKIVAAYHAINKKFIDNSYNHVFM